MNAIMNEKGRQTKLLAAFAIIAMVACVFAVALPAEDADASTVTVGDDVSFEFPDYLTGTYDSKSPMEFIYPENGSTVTIPRQLDGSIRGAVFNLAHSNPQTEVYWHLDSGYLGSTRYIHQMNIIASPGEHTVTVVDASGNTLSVRFTIC